MTVSRTPRAGQTAPAWASRQGAVPRCEWVTGTSARIRSAPVRARFQRGVARMLRRLAVFVVAAGWYIAADRNGGWGIVVVVGVGVAMLAAAKALGRYADRLDRSAEPSRVRADSSVWALVAQAYGHAQQWWAVTPPGERDDWPRVDGELVGIDELALQAAAARRRARADSAAAGAGWTPPSATEASALMEELTNRVAKMREVVEQGRRMMAAEAERARRNRMRDHGEDVRVLAAVADAVLATYARVHARVGALGITSGLPTPAEVTSSLPRLLRWRSTLRADTLTVTTSRWMPPAVARLARRVTEIVPARADTVLGAFGRGPGPLEERIRACQALARLARVSRALDAIDARARIVADSSPAGRPVPASTLDDLVADLRDRVAAVLATVV